MNNNEDGNYGTGWKNPESSKDRQNKLKRFGANVLKAFFIAGISVTVLVGGYQGVKSMELRNAPYEYSPETDIYVVQEGEGWNAAAYAIDNVDSSSNITIIVEHLKEMPENDNVESKDGVIHIGTGVTIPKSVTKSND